MTDSKGRIILKEIKIDDFAVKLKISCDLPPEESLKGEARRRIENMKCCSQNDIELSQLVDKDNRVTFIRGIAGMGKSVLAKQLAYGWADSKMYETFPLCIMFECRDISCFAAKNDGNLEKHELLKIYLKTIFQYELGDGEGILFVIDGLDELHDIHTSDSLIAQLLSRKICSGSKVIVTGRPHIESKLEKFGEIGGLRKVEILGLSSEQIERYVEKFPSPPGVTVDLSSARDSSKSFLPIIHVPQFLNTFCCITILLKGNAIHNAAEVYSWTIYLMLKQHANKFEPNEPNIISSIFQAYSKELFTLSQVCYKLLNENKFILLKEDIESYIAGCGKGKNFVQSLFHDASDNFDEKVCFEHLTLLEFLSSIHICGSTYPLDLIGESLKKNFMETVVFACQLIGGLSSCRIIKEMLKNAVKVESFDENYFLAEVLRLLQECDMSEAAKFRRSVDIVLCFLNTSTNNKQAMLPSIKKLKCNIFCLHAWETKKLFNIKEHLVNICSCTEEELRTAYKNIQIELFTVNDFETIGVARYLGCVNAIEVNGMTMNLNSARKHIESAMAGGSCKKLRIEDCTLEGDQYCKQSSEPMLDVLTMRGCTFMSEKSFVNSCHWGISSSIDFQLLYLKIENDWWYKFIKIIQEEKVSNKNSKLKNLDVYHCMPTMTKEIESKVGRVANYVTMYLCYFIRDRVILSSYELREMYLERF